MVNLSLMKVVISAFSVVSKVSEDSSFKLIDVVGVISSVVSLGAHQFDALNFEYCTRAIITRPWFQTARDYKPRILGSKIE